MSPIHQAASRTDAEHSEARTLNVGDALAAGPNTIAIEHRF
jgi:hypothetical protein